MTPEQRAARFAALSPAQRERRQQLANDLYAKFGDAAADLTRHAFEKRGTPLRYLKKVLAASPQRQAVILSKAGVSSQAGRDALDTIFGRAVNDRLPQAPG